MTTDLRGCDIGPCGQFLPDRVRKCTRLGKVIRVRPSGCKGARKSVFSDKGCTRDGMKSILLQNVAQFHQTVIVTAVAEQHDRHGQRTAAHDRM